MYFYDIRGRLYNMPVAAKEDGNVLSGFELWVSTHRLLT